MDVTQQAVFMGSERGLPARSRPLAAPWTMTVLLGSVIMNEGAERRPGFGFS